MFHRAPVRSQAPAEAPAAVGKGPRRAAAVVEMAVVSPLLFLLLLGMIEFGRAMMVANVVTSSAREGARVACVPNGANSDVTAAVNRELTAAGVPTDKATLKVLVNGTEKDAATAVTGDAVTVSVSVPYKDVTWLPAGIFLGSSATAGAQVVMRRE
jgi:Flp pilus assembly protein TadG